MGRKLRSTPKKAKRLQQPAGNLVFVRFGELPEDECSEVGGVFQGSWTPTAYETIKKVQGGRREPGVSCFEAKRQRDGSLLLVAGKGKAGKGLRSGFAGMVRGGPEGERPIFEVQGEVVGRGSDGEPLLAGCTAEELPLTTAVRLPPPEDRNFRIVAAWNEWRRLDGVRGGYRTDFGSENAVQALGPLLRGE